MLFQKRPLAAAEIYSLAAESAHQIIRRSMNVRRDNMMASGELALSLAKLGSLVMGHAGFGQAAVPTENPTIDDSLVGDWISYGAELSFAVMDKVVNPAAKLVGPHHFAVRACSPNGKVYTEVPNGYEGTLPLPRSLLRQRYVIGNEREDYWTAASMGIADKVSGRAPGTSRRKVVKEAEELARTGHEYPYAITALHQAGTFTLQAALQAEYANQASNEPYALSVTAVSLDDAAVLAGDGLSTPLLLAQA